MNKITEVSTRIASFNFNPGMVPLALRIYITVLPRMIKYLMPRWENDSLPRYQAIIKQWKTALITKLTGSMDKKQDFS